MSSTQISATYRIETPLSVEEAAETIVKEQSSGTFVDVPGETEALRDRHGANIDHIDSLGTVNEPSLPGALDPPESGSSKYTQGIVKVSFPIENVGPSLPNLLTTVAGNLFVLQELSGIRLIDLDIPSSLAEAYPGPQFGISGTRDLLGVEGRPILGTIIKPNVGLDPTQTAEIVEEIVESGVDFIKDDELIADPPYSPIEDRINEVMSVIDNYRDQTGKEVMYACNITGDIDELLERHDTVAEAGGNCIMVSMNSIGITGLTKLRRESDLPIHGHRNGWGALSRCPQLGFDYSAYMTFFRLAGVDHLHVSGLRNKFYESDESVVQSARACQTPISDEDDKVLPVFSSGQWAGQAHDTYQALGNADLLYLAGGGIMGHPDGPAAGVTHLRQGWEAALRGVPLDKYAEDHEELRTAIEFYSGDRQ